MTNLCHDVAPILYQWRSWSNNGKYWQHSNMCQICCINLLQTQEAELHYSKYYILGVYDQPHYNKIRVNYYSKACYNKGRLYFSHYQTKEYFKLQSKIDATNIYVNIIFHIVKGCFVY